MKLSIVRRSSFVFCFRVWELFSDGDEDVGACVSGCTIYLRLSFPGVIVRMEVL
jgi:hypothetical protein